MKVQYYALCWRLKWRGGWESNHWTVSHPPQPTLVNKVPYPYKIHHHRHKAKFCIYLTSRLQFLGSLWNYLKKNLSVETKDHSTLLIWQSLPPTVPAPSLCFWAQFLCDPMCHAMSSPWEFEYVRLISWYQFHLLSFRCHVFGHLHISRVKLSLSPKGWRASNQNMVVYFCEYTKYNYGTLWNNKFYGM